MIPYYKPETVSAIYDRVYDRDPYTKKTVFPWRIEAQDFFTGIGIIVMFLHCQLSNPKYMVNTNWNHNKARLVCISYITNMPNKYSCPYS